MNHLLASQDAQQLLQLLLHETSVNRQLGLQLLAGKQDWLASFLPVIEVLLLLETGEDSYETVATNVQTLYPDFSWEQSALWLLHLSKLGTHLGPQKLMWMLDAFWAEESQYQPWLLQVEPQQALYEQLADYLMLQDAAFSEELLQTNFTLESLTIYQLILDKAPYWEQHQRFAKAIERINFQQLPKTKQQQLLKSIQQADKRYPQANFLYLQGQWLDLTTQLLPKVVLWELCCLHHPEFVPVRIAYLALLLKHQRLAKAKKIAFQLLELPYHHNLDEAWLYYSLGRIYWYAEKDYQQAVHYWAKSLEVSPYYNDPLKELLELTTAEQDHAAALQWYQFALKLTPEDFTYLCKLGELSVALKDNTAAIDYYQQTLEIMPTYPPALEALERLKH